MKNIFLIYTFLYIYILSFICIHTLSYIYNIYTLSYTYFLYIPPAAMRFSFSLPHSSFLPLVTQGQSTTLPTHCVLPAQDL